MTPHEKNCHVIHVYICVLVGNTLCAPVCTGPADPPALRECIGRKNAVGHRQCVVPVKYDDFGIAFVDTYPVIQDWFMKSQFEGFGRIGKEFWVEHLRILDVCI